MAIVGCGQIADAHLQELRRLDEFDVVGVCDSYEDLAYQAATRFGVPHAYTSLDLLLSERRPDVVHVTTPPHTHASIVTRCLREGSHVYVEKPFTPTVEEAEALVRTAESLDRRICLGHDQLLDPAWIDVRDRVRSGALGDVVHVDAVQGYNFDGPFGRVLVSEPDHWVHRLPGKVFQNVVSHALARILDMLPPHGHPHISAHWFSTRPDGLLSELRASIRVDQASASLVFTGAARSVPRLARIIGTKGTIEVDMDTRTVRTPCTPRLPGAFAKVEAPYLQAREGAANLARNLGRLWRSDLHYFQGMNNTFRAFGHSIRTGGPSPVTHAEALRVTRVMDQMFSACATPAIKVAV